MERFNLKNKILMGVTLFSMFFGAGNLIFPPFLGAQAGTSGWPALAGFAVSAVGLPVLGVIAVTLSGGLDQLASRVHPRFAVLYILILYLAIGPCLAIPRTASTSFSMAVLPFWSEEMPAAWLQFAYSLVFFAAAAAVAMHPEKLTEYLGKKLTPVLLALIVIVFAASCLKAAGPIPAPGEAYASLAPVKGFLYGYQTMDTLAALNFGMIIAMNIRAKGIRQEKAVMRETVSAGWIAGIFLLAVYGMLTFVGMRGGSAFSDASDGTGILSEMVGFLFGKGGMVILAVIFVIACFNTCVGLFSCCGKYFSGVFPGLSYSRWVLVFAFVSMVISNVGLEAILNFSQPALNAIYPLSILLIFLSCTHRWLGRFRAVYPWSAALCGIVSVLTVLDQQGIMLPGAAALLHRIPAYAAGFGWLLPSVLGICIGMAVSQIKIKAGVGHNHIGNDPEQSQSHGQHTQQEHSDERQI